MSEPAFWLLRPAKRERLSRYFKQLTEVDRSARLLTEFSIHVVCINAKGGNVSLAREVIAR